MVDEGKAVAGGVLGRLPAWPRKPLNNSVIAAEQAYRKRSGLPLLSDEDMEALRAGQPMSWEGGEGAAPAAPAAPAAAPPAPAAAGPVTTPSAPASSAAPSPAAAEQARRKRNNLPRATLRTSRRWT